jgi:hypothetical protein
MAIGAGRTRKELGCSLGSLQPKSRRVKVHSPPRTPLLSFTRRVIVRLVAGFPAKLVTVLLVVRNIYVEAPPTTNPTPWYRDICANAGWPGWRVQQRSRQLPIIGSGSLSTNVDSGTLEHFISEDRNIADASPH